MKIEAVLFDLGGTLIKTAPVSETMKKILEDFGVECLPEEVERAREAAEITVDIEELPILGDEFWLKWNTQILEYVGCYKNSRLLAEKIAKLWWQYANAELYPDAEETLKRLKQRGLKLGLVTNGLKSDLKDALPKVGLKGFFDVEITSDAVGKIKPHKEIFLHALKKLSVSPQEAVFVGDMVEYDYKGAETCGLKAVLIDRENKVKDDNVEKIGSLTEILAYI